jgi:tRNA-splicing ligase RtcB
VGSVIALRGAVAPAAVGVDIGCGMAAVKTSLTAADLPDNLKKLRSAIEESIPVGRESHGAAARQEASRAVSEQSPQLFERYADLDKGVRGLGRLASTRATTRRCPTRTSRCSSQGRRRSSATGTICSGRRSTPR